MSFACNITDIELYGFLGLQKFASFDEIKKAYRKLALKSHPDKNPDDKNAAERFLKLGEVYAFLSDTTKRAEYDTKLKQKHQAEERLKELDVQTQYHKKRFIEKEREFLEKKREDEKKAKEEEQRINRMREEGRRRQFEEQSKEKGTRAKRSRLDDNLGYNVKVSWNAKKKDAYSADEIKTLFAQFGKILDIVHSKKKAGLSLVNYANKESAILSTTVTGKPSCPLTVKLSFEIDGIQQTTNAHTSPNDQHNILDEFLKENGIDVDQCYKAAENSKSKEDEVDETTGLPIKYVYSHGTDTIFACAAKFTLPTNMRLRGNEEVVHEGFLVRLWPSERDKFLTLVE